MIELRWVNRFGEKWLEYRNRIPVDTMSLAQNKEWPWSEWQRVPEVLDDKVS